MGFYLPVIIASDATDLRRFAKKKRNPDDSQTREKSWPFRCSGIQA